MSACARARTTLAVLAIPVTALFATAIAQAQEARSLTREAAKHFQRGVTLYTEADYRAALVEFKRAFALVPNGAVLYNIGEAQYQLQDYAGALKTFRRYLAEASPSEGHRAQVESNVEVLRTRVGRITISTAPPGAEITLDDQAIGKTPLDEPVLVSIGRRKVVASLPGRLPVTRYVEVAAEDNVPLPLVLPAGAEPVSLRPATGGQPVS